MEHCDSSKSHSAPSAPAPASASETSNSSTAISHHSHSHSTSSNSSASQNNSLRDLDELLMGGNDLDALPFEFGCDFGAAFEDKYLVPPLSTTSATRLSSMSSDTGFDILPPLSLLSPPSATFQLNLPLPSPFRHFDYDRLKAASSGVGAASHVHSEPSSVASSPLKKSDNSVETCDGAETMSAASSRTASGPKSTHIGRWTKKEHELFLEGLKLYGKSWKKISSLVTTRTLVQIRTHAQKYLQKQTKSAQRAAAAAAAAEALGTNSPVSATKSSRPQAHRFGQHLGDHLDAWRGAPVSFADLLPTPSSSLSSGAGATAAFARSAPSSYVLPALGKRDGGSGASMCKLDQLLQDEPSHYASIDGYYPSPMGTDDEILHHPMYAQWSRTDPHASATGGMALLPPSSSSSSVLALPTKRRRLETHQHQHQHQQLVNPMEAMATSASSSSQDNGHSMTMFALGSHAPSAGGLYSSMDFGDHAHLPHLLLPPHQLHASYAPSAFADSSSSSSFSSQWQSQQQHEH